MSRLVYDSDAGRICPDCQQKATDCVCKSQSDRDAGDGIVRVRREVRNGKPVTVVMGLPGTDQELRATAKTLKQRCGSGGTSRDGVVEIQGDHREVVVAFLAEQGHTVKRAGG